MKRSEMLDHIKEDLLEKLKHRWLERKETDKWAEFTANQLLDMIEGFGMLPPPKVIEAVTESLAYCYYNKISEFKDIDGWYYFDRDNSQLWEPEDD
jgi:hypothetical protein